MLKNQEILEALKSQAGCKTDSEYARYLSDKYGVDIKRQQVNQFSKSERLTITHLLLREALEKG